MASALGEVLLLPRVRRAGLLLVSGQVLLGMGDDNAGRLRLTKALKHAHTQLGNAQVVVQVVRPPSDASPCASCCAAQLSDPDQACRQKRQAMPWLAFPQLCGTPMSQASLLCVRSPSVVPSD